MVERQLRAGGISDERVLGAMAEVPREEFVPEAVRDRAYTDGALPIGHGQTISQPWVVAAICAGLRLRGGERVLEVGSGSGYSTAVLASLVRPGGSVLGFELVPELAERASQVLGRLGYDEVEVEAGDGGLDDAPRSAQWDAIAVHAAAPAVPRPLARALKPGGRLVAPIAEGSADMLTSFVREDDGGPEAEPSLRAEPIAPCRFVPLLGESGFPSSGR